MTRNIKFVCTAVKWFDKVNGNTYHSVKVERMRDGKILFGRPMEYGYGDQYRYTALDLMVGDKWIPPKYRGRHENGIKTSYLYERENNYPIVWNVRDGLKKEMINNIL